MSAELIAALAPSSSSSSSSSSFCAHASSALAAAGLFASSSSFPPSFDSSPSIASPSAGQLTSMLFVPVAHAFTRLRPRNPLAPRAGGECTCIFCEPIFSLTRTQLLTVCDPLSAKTGFQLLRCIVNGANTLASGPSTIPLPGAPVSQGGSEISSEDVVIIIRACLKGLQARC